MFTIREFSYSGHSCIPQFSFSKCQFLRIIIPESLQCRESVSHGVLGTFRTLDLLITMHKDLSKALLRFVVRIRILLAWLLVSVFTEAFPANVGKGTLSKDCCWTREENLHSVHATYFHPFPSFGAQPSATRSWRLALSRSGRLC